MVRACAGDAAGKDTAFFRYVTADDIKIFEVKVENTIFAKTANLRTWATFNASSSLLHVISSTMLFV